MKPEIKELWIAALESGEYKQGRSALRTRDDKFCCLGVLCDLAVKAGIAEWEKGKGNWRVDGNSDYLPESVMEWSGIISIWGSMPKRACCLSDLNDIDRMTFPEIAQVIREEF